MENPYKGLDPFEKRDASIFYGRGADVRMIVASLYAAPVTVLYGPTGVGKSSVLQAGVVPKLEEYGAYPVYLRVWSGDWQADLKRRCSSSVGTNSIDLAQAFDVYVKEAAEEAGKLLVVILDQFEDYLDLKPVDTREFDEALARAIRKADIRVSFLLGIREDRFADLDRLKAKVPKLFGNTLRLGPLDQWGAREAIVGPLGAEAEVEEKLVDDFVNGRQEIPPIEIQIVFEQIWQKDSSYSPIMLRAETYSRAGDPIENFVHPLIEGIKGGRTCRLILEELVPESGHRTTRELKDLQKYGANAETILNDLRDQKILRSDRGTGYTVYHDVIRKAVRSWCARQLAEEAQSLVTATSGWSDVWQLEQTIDELKKARKQAEKISRAAAVRELSARALLFVAHDAVRATELAIEALAAGEDSDSEAADFLFRYVVQTGRIQEGRVAAVPGLRAEAKDDSSIDVLEVKAGGAQLWKTLPGVGGRIAGIVFSPSGSRLAARLQTGEVQVWDLRTGVEMAAGEAGVTPLGAVEIREIFNHARATVGLPETVIAASATEPGYNPFLASENEEAFHVDAIS